MQHDRMIADPEDMRYMADVDRKAEKEQHDDGRRVVPIEEAIARIGDGERIHTFLSGGFCLLGADHDRDGLIQKMRDLGVEESGAQASAMGHTLVIVKYDPSPLFIEAKPRAASHV